jgi:FemAB-related protein (PEP-CTERM system-associated)
MQAASVFDIKIEIKKYLKKDPQRVEASLEKHISNGDFLSNAKQKLRQIQTLQSEIDDKDTQRKTLSRQIGPARKKNLDCQQLIDDVAALSAQIKNYESERNLAIDEIATTLATTEDSVESVSKSPRHFNATETEQNDDRDSNQSSELLLSIENASGEWLDFVTSRSNATVYHDPRWHPLIERNFNHKTYSLVSRTADNRIVGVMPLTHLNSRIFGSFTISMPYFNYGGPLASTAAAEQQLMQFAAQHTEQLGCSHMEIRETHLREDWPASQKKVSMVLKLPQDDDTLDRQLGSKLRAQVKRAASHELTAITGGSELLNEFYDVYSRNMRDLGTPAYGKKFFADILATFPEQAFLTIVRRHNRALAAGFLIGYNDKLEIPWASSLRKYNHLGANMFLYRSILTEAISRGYEYFDFGRSTKDANTYKFKKQWGAQEYPLAWHYWTASGELPEINPDNPKYKLVIAVWKRIPVFVTRIIGPMIARNLP